MTSADPAPLAERLPRAAAVLAAGRDRGLHLGGQIYVSVAGRAVADAAFGEARPGEPMRRDHLVAWLSSGKPVAAVAVAQLWEQDRLALDDPVASHLPEFARHGKEAITLRHLLTHTGGFRMLDTGWPRDPWESILARICDKKPEPGWVPGTRAGYHRTESWFVLGEIVRRVDGRPFDRFVRTEIFEPLGMTDSWIGMPDERFDAYGERIAPLWDTTASPPASHGWEGRRHVTRSSPGGGGRGPIRELARLYECLLDGGRWGAARLLAPPTVEALVARHRVGLTDRTFRLKIDWGLGFILDSSHYGEESRLFAYGRHASARTFGHAGSRSSVAFADPERRLVVAVAVNGTPSDVGHRRRFLRLTEAIYEDLGFAPPVTAG